MEDNRQEGNVFFKVLINKIEHTEKAALDESLFKQIYPDMELTSESDFRNEVKQDIEAEWEGKSHQQLIDQLYHELLDHTNIDFPEEFLKRWMQTNTEKQKTPEEIEQEFLSFVNQLKWTVIIDKLAKDNGVEVAPEDVREYAKLQLFSYMGGYQISMDQPWINDYIDKMVNDKKFMEDNFPRILSKKVLFWAETQVNPAEVTISADEFTRLQESHHH